MNHKPRLSDALAAIEFRSEDSDNTVLTVERYENHIYFYSEVNPDRCLALMRALRDVDSWLRNETLARELPTNSAPHPIWLHIYSGGGDLFAGLAVADQIRHISTPVYSIVEGYAASAATLISMACQRRYILPSSFMMIHQLSGMAWGTHEEFKDVMNMQEMAMGKLIDFYEQRSKMSRDDIDAMLKRNSWMDSAKALENGFVDEIKGA